MNTFSRFACCNSVRIHTSSLLFVIFHLLCAFIIFLESSSVIACLRAAEITFKKGYYYYYYCYCYNYYYYYLRICWFFVVAFYVVSFVCKFLRTSILYLFAVTFIHGHFAL